MRRWDRDEGDDPYLWLEDLDGADAAGWVRHRNAETVAALTGGGRFGTLRDEIRQVLDADDRIPYPRWRGDRYCYSFWRDAAHPRGLCRRTTLERYRRPAPEWDVLLDVDALAAEEGENWVWSGVTVRRPDYERCLISLSRGGADAVVAREFDLVRQFFATLADGTRVPYFVVGEPDAPAGPALLTGYGGYEISQTPDYDGVIGRGWVARGGTYVVANIRGGGEYGPEWHRAAMRENRPRAYEDFAAVAADLVERGITTPAQLGIEGGSNGGLLTEQHAFISALMLEFLWRKLTDSQHAAIPRQPSTADVGERPLTVETQ
ncbi:prolyl oligopeptidase family serine peptidase [Micromonospora sp. NPDC049836]|uniref:prolyl oligopeptidase family serine peptidase n=1 Tax=Micromonospora sp. NPDC049836 TaxID=3364274 RepID=UPI0037A83DBD